MKILKLIAKIILVLFLLFILMAVMSTFATVSEIERKLKGEPSDNANFSSEAVDKGKLILGDGSNYSLGSDKAKLTIVEFADFGCPYCKKSFPKIREISLNYKEDIKYIFRDLPIVKDYSIDLALGARCAGEQGLFWQMHDRLFIEQGAKDSYDISLLAERIGADSAKFKTCFESNKYLPQIKKDLSDAEALGLLTVGTPVWFINGQMVAGDIPEETFQQIINEYLK